MSGCDGVSGQQPFNVSGCDRVSGQQPFNVSGCDGVSGQQPFNMDGVRAATVQCGSRRSFSVWFLTNRQPPWDCMSSMGIA